MDRSSLSFLLFSSPINEWNVRHFTNRIHHPSFIPSLMHQISEKMNTKWWGWGEGVGTVLFNASLKIYIEALQLD